jgi:putative phage-type endonuclease
MIVQGTPEWHAARLGKATASRIADIMAQTKTGPGAARKNYHAELVAERLTGQPAEKFTNAAMAWGTEREPQARASYTLATFNAVDEVGFIDHPALPMSGASPDGLVGAEGLVEIKCPNTATHIETLLGGSVEGKYLKQMQWQMACTGRAWCDFVSFDPRLPDDMQLFIRRVERDDAAIAEIETAVRDFLAEVDATVEALTQKYRNAA